MNKSTRFVTLAVATVIAAATLAFFVKPKAPLLDLVSPKQELSTYEAQYPGDTRLADRVIKSYALAMVLVHSPYTHPNVTALENVRSWARDNFHKQPDFLHPSSLPVTHEPNNTVFGAVGYNLFANFKFFLEEQIGELLRLQIAVFHNTSSYETFNISFFDTFGRDGDTATLLARYQSDRAKLAVDAVLWSLLWVGACISFAWTLLRPSKTPRFDRLRLVLGNFWLLLGGQYFIVSWVCNEVSSLISSFVAVAVGLYFLRPVALLSHAESPRRITRILLSNKWVAMGAWCTLTFVSIQLLTWIRGGVPDSPDPVTLILSSLSGDFIHDPVNAKRTITSAIGILWLMTGLWTLRQYFKNEPLQPEADANIESLQTAYAID